MTVLETYKRELLRWNRKINLIGPEVEAHLDQHIEEALQAAAILRPAGEVLDFGSGGGLPAIPMAIAAPAARFHLVESDQKKWAFLKHAVRACKLDAVVYGERLERVIPRLPPNLHFSLVTSRAVGHPEQWVPLLLPHLDRDGRVALFLGSDDLPQIARLRKQAVHELARGVLALFHVEQS